MNPKEVEDLDRYLTEPTEYSSGVEIEKESTDWNKDYFGETIDENDWLLIAYFKLEEIETKFAVKYDGFLNLLDKYGPDDLITEKLNFISGKEWLAMQKENITNGNLI
ncbi:hypothetical protein [Melissococcus plutonius]|uniref:hypothetical protein n=2 Tax=Melissococcus plutonius TaxID=33970 RepID=UPI0021E5A0BD|nr:hypothetical protein [Melissococcus plutonius]MCV2520613.1 hypothetical protein [Melissococcus plutonius]MCV2528198.1 hypothetical protein [Melissococcus plutonius]